MSNSQSAETPDRVLVNYLTPYSSLHTIHRNEEDQKFYCLRCNHPAVDKRSIQAHTPACRSYSRPLPTHPRPTPSRDATSATSGLSTPRIKTPANTTRRQHQSVSKVLTPAMTRRGSDASRTPANSRDASRTPAGSGAASRTPAGSRRSLPLYTQASSSAQTTPAPPGSGSRPILLSPATRTPQRLHGPSPAAPIFRFNSRTTTPHRSTLPSGSRRKSPDFLDPNEVIPIPRPSLSTGRTRDPDLAFLMPATVGDSTPNFRLPRVPSSASSIADPQSPTRLLLELRETSRAKRPRSHPASPVESTSSQHRHSGSSGDREKRRRLDTPSPAPSLPSLSPSQSFPRSIPSDPKLIYELRWSAWRDVTKEMLDGMRGQCAPCFGRGLANWRHGERKCPITRDKNWDEWHKPALEWGKGYCWFCLVPQGRIRGWHVWLKDNRDCVDKNLFKPALYAFLTDPRDGLHPQHCPFLPDDVLYKPGQPNLYAVREWLSTPIPGFAPMLMAHKFILWLAFRRRLVDYRPELDFLFASDPGCLDQFYN